MSIRIEKIQPHQENEVKKIGLTNSQGTKVEILTLGATLHSFEINTRIGNIDIIVAPQTLKGYRQQYKEQPYFFGSTIGRYAGRISKGSFILNGKKYQLEADEKTHIHGGDEGFDRKIWQLSDFSEKPIPKVTLTLHSPHLEGNYPGNLFLEATFSLDHNNTLEVHYCAISDHDTYLNMTNHAYFNLGHDSITEHFLYIESDTILEVGKDLIPTGKKIPAWTKDIDFTNWAPLKKLEKIKGLDTPFCHDNTISKNPRIKYYAPRTDLQLEINGNQYCTVIFTPKHIQTTQPIKPKCLQKTQFPSICFEMQHFPDTPNNNNFPSCILKKGETYVNHMSYKLVIGKS
jgi:aldose 1-epimerase